MTSPTAPLTVITESFASEPGVDTALAAVLLDRANDGGPEVLRLYRPGRVVAFGRQDVVASGYPAAVRAARAGGFDAIERLAGGRAAVFTPQTIAFSWAIPDDDPRTHTQARFELVSGLFRDALAALGVDARIGEVEGEYCPGRYSVNASGSRKLLGVGQRLKRRAAHAGGVLVVDDSAAINAILEPVYAALQLEWRPQATGAVADVLAGVTHDDVLTAVFEQIQLTRVVDAGPFDSDVLAEARARAPHLRSP